MLNDAEVLVMFMEPKPIEASTFPFSVRFSGTADGQWERMYSMREWWEADPEERLWEPRYLTLNECHLIEARLTKDQWKVYRDALIDDPEAISGYFECGLIHAKAEQKIAALATILRPLVEGTEVQR